MLQVDCESINFPFEKYLDDFNLHFFLKEHLAMTEAMFLKIFLFLDILSLMFL